ncbi:MAG: vitamin K epoxide reductase family protein [Ferruginibacter sp.]
MALQKAYTTAPELWQLTQTWLLLLGNKPNTKFCREEITTHPDYPAMTAVTDFLDAGNMHYNAVQADASYIHEFNYPLLAHISQPGQQYLHIIPNATEWDKQKEITQHWSGIALFPEKNTAWQNEQNSLYEKEFFKNKVFAAVLIIGALGLFIASAMQQANIATVFGLLSLLGLVISIFLLGTELGYQSQLVKQVCGAVSSGGCEKVLKSKYAKGMLGITPADAAVLYFAAQFIFYLLSPWFTSFLNFLLLTAFAGAVIAAWSIYTQAVKLKQWCTLCLGVVAVLLLQTGVTFLITGLQLLNLSSIQPLLFFIFLIAILTVAMLPVKTLIKTNKTNKQQLAELKKWKTDAGLFITQWQQEQEVDTTIWENDLLLGDVNAPILIMVACNPYCGPCAKAHTQLDELLHRFAGKLKVQVRLLCNAKDEKDKLTIAVKAILQKAEMAESNTELQQMLTDWFTWMDYKKWIDKWQPDITLDVNKRLNEHSKWVADSAVQFTPTFFINGRKLPGRYKLNDIAILLPQLAEIFTNETVK